MEDSLLICSRTWSMVMKVPVRPTPALEGEGGEVSATHCHTHSLSPAVDHHGALGGLVLFLHSPVEGQDGRGIVGHPVVRPGREVEMGHLQRMLRAARQLQGTPHTHLSSPPHKVTAHSHIPAQSGCGWCSLPVSAAQ